MAENIVAKIVNEQRHYQPGDNFSLGLSWDFPDNTPSHFEVRFVWNTEGKGDRDIAVAKTITISSPGSTGQQLIKTTLPILPYSYQGKLISILWAVEIIAFPMMDSLRIGISIAPSDKPQHINS